MPSRFETFGIDRLSLDERLELVEEICESIASEVEGAGLPRSHREELIRRIELHRDDPRAGSPWEEVRARLLDRLKANR